MTATTRAAINLREARILRAAEVLRDNPHALAVARTLERLSVGASPYLSAARVAEATGIPTEHAALALAALVGCLLVVPTTRGYRLDATLPDALWEASSEAASEAAFEAAIAEPFDAAMAELRGEGLLKRATLGFGRWAVRTMTRSLVVAGDGFSCVRLSEMAGFPMPAARWTLGRLAEVGLVDRVGSNWEASELAFECDHRFSGEPDWEAETGDET